MVVAGGSGLSCVRTSTSASARRPPGGQRGRRLFVGRRDRRTEGPTTGRGGRPADAGAILQGRPMEADDCPIRRRPSTIAVRQKSSALYDGNFPFLDYVFAFLIAVT
jgi:hypothetical protein